ncbi:MAG TPA: hypothetical protein IAA30_02385 [Candidatus Treponema faecavium]|nr:hypothetical protein [Candidatus Treponema faecavium]
MGICTLLKKTARFACAAGIRVLCAAVLLGCNGVMLPKKVNVIADPTFNVGLGKAEEKLDDYASAADIQDMLGGDTDGMTVYDYNPGGNSTMQQFALYYNLGTFDIDVSGALDAANVESTNVEIPEQTIAIPDIKIEYEFTIGENLAGQTVPIDVPDVPIGNVAFEGADLSSDGVTIAEAVVTGKLMIKTPGFDGADLQGVTLSIGDGAPSPIEGDSSSGWYFSLEKTPLVSGENSDYKLGGSITIKAGSSVPDGGVTLSVTGEITTINSVLVKLPDEITKQFSQTEEVDLIDLDGLVEQVQFSKIGAEGSFTSTLPEGNDITITVSTATVGLLDTSDVIKGGAGNTDINLTAPAQLDVSSLIDKGGKKILPFTVEIALPSEQRGDQTLYRFTTVAPGAAYTLSGSLTSVMEWESITLADDAFSNLTEGAENPLKGETAPIDLSELESTINDMIKEIAPESQALTEQIEFSGIEAYPFIIKPREDVLTDIAAAGEITLSGAGAAGSENLLVTDIRLLSSGPDLPEPGGTITEKFSYALGNVSADLHHEKITEKLNEYPSDLTVKYDISITGKDGGNVTITKDEIDKLEGGKLSIEASLLVIAPLKLKLPRGTAEVELSLSSLTGEGESSDGDLLGRTSPDSLDETLDQVIRSLDKLTVSVSYDNKFGAGLRATLTNTPERVKTADGAVREWESLTADEQKTYKLDEAFTIGAGKDKADIVNIVGADILDKVLYAYPFNPKVVITVTGTKGEDGENYIKIPRGALFGASVSLAAGVSINGVYDFSTGEFVL